MGRSRTGPAAWRSDAPRIGRAVPGPDSGLTGLVSLGRGQTTTHTEQFCDDDESCRCVFKFRQRRASAVSGFDAGYLGRIGLSQTGPVLLGFDMAPTAQ